jgi:hypothetical protein
MFIFVVEFRWNEHCFEPFLCDTICFTKTIEEARQFIAKHAAMHKAECPNGWFAILKTELGVDAWPCNQQIAEYYTIDGKLSDEQLFKITT